MPTHPFSVRVSYYQQQAHAQQGYAAQQPAYAPTGAHQLPTAPTVWSVNSTPTPKGFVPVHKLVTAGLIAVVLFVISGFVHITYGAGHGPGICQKESWGLGDTFVDLDDFVGKPVITLVSRAKTVRALVRCEKIELPASLR